MTQPALAFDAGPDTFLDAVVELFKRRPLQWIDGLEIAKVGGVYAYRTRISECRTKRRMTVENRLRRERRANGSMIVHSEYRWMP